MKKESLASGSLWQWQGLKSNFGLDPGPSQSTSTMVPTASQSNISLDRHVYPDDTPLEPYFNHLEPKCVDLPILGAHCLSLIFLLQTIIDAPTLER